MKIKHIKHSGKIKTELSQDVGKWNLNVSGLKKKLVLYFTNSALYRLVCVCVSVVKSVGT